ncbi:MAG: ABC transporter permease [Oscillospiraceae bacterium]
MNFRQAFKLAAKSIMARKGRTLLTMLGVIIGLTAVITLVSYAKGESAKILQQMESMGTNQINVSASKWGVSSDGMFQSIYDYCLSLTDLVDGVTPSTSTWGNVQYGVKSSEGMQQQPQILLGSDQWSMCNAFKVETGRDLSIVDFKKYNSVCVLGSKMKELFFGYSDPIGKKITINGVPFTVVGVFAQKDFSGNEWSMDNVLLLPYTAQRALAAGGMGISSNWSEFVVKAKSKSSTNEAIARLNGFLTGLIGDPQSPTTNGYFNVYSNNQSIDSITSANEGQQRLLGGIAAISLLVGGIGIMNIMLVTVTERTREIGIRKAIGAERKTIIVQFLIEACMICGLGGIIGILLSYPTTWIYCKMQLGYIVQPDPTMAATALVVSVLLGVIFGLYPAIKASGLQPVEALRAD